MKYLDRERSMLERNSSFIKNDIGVRYYTTTCKHDHKIKEKLRTKLTTHY